jgi:AcrR family transcriptional regulator
VFSRIVFEPRALGHNGLVAVEKWTPERRRQLTRTALVEAAAVVFARRGFHGASLDEIADTAGFTRGAIYKNFEGKEDLFFAVIDHHNQIALQAFEEEFDGGAALAKLDASKLASAWRDTLTRDPDFLALDLEFRLYAIRNPDVRERFATHQRQTRATIARFIEEQVQGAGFKITLPAATLAAIVDAASEGLLQSAYLDPREGNLFEAFLEILIPAVVLASGTEPPAVKPGSGSRSR